MEDESDLSVKDIFLNRIVELNDWLDKSKFFSPKYAIFDVILLTAAIFKPFYAP